MRCVQYSRCCMCVQCVDRHVYLTQRGKCVQESLLQRVYVSRARPAWCPYNSCCVALAIYQRPPLTCQSHIYSLASLLVVYLPTILLLNERGASTWLHNNRGAPLDLTHSTCALIHKIQNCDNFHLKNLWQ